MNENGQGLEPKTRRAWKSGFSVIELAVVIGIIAILVGIAAPSTIYYLKSNRVRNEARYLESIFQRGRMLAAVNQKPVRVVLNCAGAPSSGCVMNLQVASYKGAGIEQWLTINDYYHQMDERVEVVPVASSPAHDGKAVPDTLFWAIFMPDSRVYSNPRPFNVAFHYSDDDSSNVWRVSLSADSGRAEARRNTSAS